MRRISRLTLALAGASLCFLYAAPATAQSQNTPQPGPPMSEPQPRTPSGTVGPAQNGPMQAPAGPTEMPVKADDQKFVKEAALGGMTEVELGKLAQEKASSDAVKEFGKRLEQDHTKSIDRLKQAAAQDGLAVPASLDSKHRKRVDKLSKLSGEAFDKAFVKDAVKDHQKDIREFKNEEENGTHVNIKNFAAETAPTLQAHLAMAKSLKQSNGASLTASTKEQ